MSVEAAALKGLEKTIDLIKTSGWQTAAGAAAFGLVWWLIAKEAVPRPDPLAIILIVLAFFFCLFLTLAAIASAAFRRFNIWLAPIFARRAVAARAEKEIPFMTDSEQAIIGYLLHHNMKVFEADDDGGNAASLIGRGFVTILVRRGQMVDLTRVPMTVLDPVWNVWKRNQDAFPYQPIYNGRREMLPWRISWMLR
jgi:hypothetical protein